MVRAVAHARAAAAVTPGLTWDGDLRRLSLEALFEESPDAIYVFDTAGRHIAANPVLADRTGLPWERLRTMDFVPIVHPDDRERVEAEFAAAVGGSVRHYQCRGVRADGTTFHADVVNIPIRAAGDVVAVLGVARDIDELALVRESLDRSDGLVRIAGRIARIGGWAVDLETGERHWSEEMHRLLQQPSGAAPPAANMLDLIEPAERADVLAGYRRCAAEGTPFDVRARFSLPDGSHMHARVVGEPVRDESGRITAVEGALIDITAQVEERRERRQLESRLTGALDGVTDAIMFVRPDWRIEFVNATARAVFASAGTELVGTSMWDLPIEARGVPEEIVREAMRTRRTMVHRLFAEPAGRWIEVTMFTAGDLLGIQARDVTEMEEARQRQIHDSRRIHAQAALLDSATDAVVMRGLSDSIEHANRAMSELVGLGDTDLRGRSLGDLLGMPRELRDEVEAALARDGHWERDLAIRRPDGEERHVETRWRLVRDPDGNADAVFCLLIDITERRRQDELLLRTQRMESIGTLASGIAHDLNNVLTPLLLSTQLLAVGESDERRSRILAGMQQTVERGADMIRQVLTFARGVEGERTIVEVGGLARRFAEFCRDILPKNIEVAVSADDDLHVLGDATQLMQVLMNLATNARDAMPEGGHLTLRARGDDSRVTIDVADDGMGMSADVLGRIFDPFFTTKGIGSGTGLGLSVSQAIARTHGGSLEAESTPGAGTTFRMELPRAAGADAEPDAADTAPAVDLTGLRILIVDDEDDIVRLASLVIEDAGGVALGASDAAAGHRILAEGPVDVILSDLVMPGTTGREFLDSLAAQHPNIPVVAMSGVPEQGAKAAERPNVRATLDKPFTAGRLLDAIILAASTDQR